MPLIKIMGEFIKSMKESHETKFSMAEICLLKDFVAFAESRQPTTRAADEVVCDEKYHEIAIRVYKQYKYCGYCGRQLRR